MSRNSSGPGLQPGVPLDMRERLELCDLMEQLGPDAPTLCEGWTTLDLAAHLVLREHFSRWSDERRAAEKAKGLSFLLGRLRAGAPLVPWRVPGLRIAFNGGEYFIHHEDVRRANGMPRRDDRPDLETLAWRMAGFAGRRAAHKMRPYGLELRRPGNSPKLYGGKARAVLTGEPSELLLYLSGRRDAAQVALSGDADALHALRGAQTAL